MNNLKTTKTISLKILVRFIVFAIILDQSTKQLCNLFLDYGRELEVTAFFNLFLVYNSGIAFSLFDDGAEYTRIILTAFSFLFAIVASYFLYQSQRKFEQIIICFLISGAIGNGIDRLIFGYVIDFLDFHLLGYHWPTFNVADSLVSFGVFLLFIDFLFVKKNNH